MSPEAPKPQGRSPRWSVPYGSEDDENRERIMEALGVSGNEAIRRALRHFAKSARVRRAVQAAAEEGE